jgi:hypothetical protein
MRVTAHNRGPDAATLHVLPTLWFRNTWAARDGPKPSLAEAGRTVRATHPELGDFTLVAEPSTELLFCENETSAGQPYAKDGIGRHVVDGAADAVNPARIGTKVAAHRVLEVPAGASASVRVRLTSSAAAVSADRVGAGFDRVFEDRCAEADAFYATVVPAGLDPDAAMVMRQALAGRGSSRA